MDAIYACNRYRMWYIDYIDLFYSKIACYCFKFFFKENSLIKLLIDSSLILKVNSLMSHIFFFLHDWHIYTIRLKVANSEYNFIWEFSENWAFCSSNAVNN